MGYGCRCVHSSTRSERLDGIEREAGIRNYAANHSDDSENHSSANQCSGSDQRRMSRASPFLANALYKVSLPTEIA
jgi:hypothetical protein